MLRAGHLYLCRWLQLTILCAYGTPFIHLIEGNCDRRALPHSVVLHQHTNRPNTFYDGQCFLYVVNYS